MLDSFSEFATSNYGGPNYVELQTLPVFDREGDDPFDSDGGRLRDRAGVAVNHVIAEDNRRGLTFAQNIVIGTWIDGQVVAIDRHAGTTERVARDLSPQSILAVRPGAVLESDRRALWQPERLEGPVAKPQ